MSDATWERTLEALEKHFKGKEVKLLDLTDWFCNNYSKLSENIKLSEFLVVAKEAGVKVR